MKYLALAAVVLALVGCAGPCQDGEKPSFWFMGVPQNVHYQTCKHKCCAEKNPKECNCSTQCDCEHGRAAK